jgi:hypothetical protein
MLDSYLEKQMEKMDGLRNDALKSILMLPIPEDNDMISITYEHLLRIIKQREDLSYSAGFFSGVAATVLEANKNKS